MFIGRFVVELSNGQEVVEVHPDEPFMPDGECLHMGWKQLESFCKTLDLKIVKMRINFRSFFHKAPDNAEAYFQNMQQVSVAGVKIDFYRGIGFLQDGKWFIAWFDEEGYMQHMEVRDA